MTRSKPGQKLKSRIPGILAKLQSDTAMVGYYLPVHSSMIPQNFSDTHLSPGIC